MLGTPCAIGPLSVNPTILHPFRGKRLRLKPLRLSRFCPGLRDGECTITSARILWTDGSKLDTGNVGAAVVWFDIRLNKWQEKRRYLGENKDSFDAELWAISGALELGIKKTRNGNPTMITVFTDSQAAIAKILASKARSGGDAIRALIYENAHEIKSSGHTPVLRWVPSHSKIPGNEKADASAKDIAHKGGRQTDHSSSLTFIKTELQRTRSAELLLWNQSKSQEREATVQGFYVPEVKSGINPILGKALKKYAMRFYQLKIGHGAIGTFLARIGVMETPEC